MIPSDESKDKVRFTVIIPKEAYKHMKAKAQSADISMNKFLCRAGSVVKVEDIVVPPDYAMGAISPMQVDPSNINNKK